MSFEKEKIRDRWAEDISEPFNDHRQDYNVMKRNITGPPIKKGEIQAAIRKMKSGKAKGPDSIFVELFEALQDYGIDKRAQHH